MARSISTIYDALLAEKANMTELNGLTGINNAQDLLTRLTTTSKVAIWSLMLYLFAYCIYTFEILLDLWRVEITNLITQNTYGTFYWYQDISKDWQYGYDLQFINNRFQYATIDEAAKIVKYASCTGISSLMLKVAKQTNSLPSPLTSAELTAFTNYIRKIKPAGIAIQVISLNSDFIYIVASIYVDYNVIDDTGTSILNSNKPVEIAIKSYLNTIDFDGKVLNSKIQDAIQAVDGVKDVFIHSVHCRSVSEAYSVVEREYETSAGYIQYDEPVNPFDSTIRYVPYV